jgi:predicted deacetylase
MSAKFLLRFDDICPTINWKVWQEIEAILIEENIQPILAVIPDNQDPTFRDGEADEHFWDRVRSWQERGWTIGLHGYQHRYITQHSGILGLNAFSEFAGLPFKEQLSKLKNALEIFYSEGVRPDVWVAPAHSFDANTIEALISLGITNISDGLSLYPYRDSRGVLWIPQQLWKLRAVPFGLWTLCIHHQHAPYTNLAHFRQNLQEYRLAITSFQEVVATYSLRKQNWVDSVFARLWGSAIRARSPFIAWAAREACAAAPLESNSVRSRELTAPLDPRATR